MKTVELFARLYLLAGACAVGLLLAVVGHIIFGSGKMNILPVLLVSSVLVMIVAKFVAVRLGRVHG